MSTDSINEKISVDEASSRLITRRSLIAVAGAACLTTAAASFLGGNQALAGVTDQVYGTGGSLTATVTVDTIEDLRDLTGMVNGQVAEVITTGRAGLFRWSASDHSTDVAADTKSGVFITPSSDLTGTGGAWVRVVSGAVDPRWFGADDSGVNDSSGAFQAAVDYFGYPSSNPGVTANHGGVIVVYPGKYKLLSSVRILNNVFFVGHGTNTILEIHDVGLIFGRSPNETGGRVDVLGGVSRFKIIGGVGVEGHISKLYGSTNAAFGFTSITTNYAGYKLPDSSANVSTVGIRVQGAYAPFVISENFFYGLDSAMQIRAQYGLTICDNRVWYTNVAVETTGLVTTTNIRDNTFERCAIGVFLKYPCSFMRIDHNIIEANYAGCDLLIYNSGEDIEVTRNYFEGSTNNIEIRGDSGLPYAPHKLYFERNTGMKVHCRLSQLYDVFFKQCWMNGVDFNLFVGGKMGNIVFEDCYDGPSENPMDVNTRLTFNTVSATFAKFIEYRGRVQGVDVGNANFPQLATRKAQSYYVATSATSSPQLAFAVRVPTDAVDATLMIRGQKYMQGQDTTLRQVEWRAAIKRTSNSVSSVAEIKLISDTEFTTISTTALLAAPVSPTVNISGDPNKEQSVAFNLLNGQTGGTTAKWVLKAELITNHNGVEFS
ncbi:hypothetical protein FE783_18185 [Paenibacillus mesophilus]|uniref:NosD domain-containing protein n=1 Tax=Paenibacillus mesophilus TaxID=2582849 RepID=UPI00110D5BC5|nr:NosD domain-containing protein [Paenibacillus mesophilus]TMV48444.1 hypothetical protein FE783_18185 [Paenibacillus mesophilus]